MDQVTYSWSSHDRALRRRAYLATGLVQAILILLLLYFCFETPLPLPGEEGIAVALGEGDAGRYGTPGRRDASQDEQAPARARASREASNRSVESQLTQDHEEAPSVPTTPAPRATPERREEPARRDRQEAPSSAREDAQAREPEQRVNPAALFPGKSSRGDGGGGGESSAGGQQGSPEGSGSQGASTGQGMGTGSSGMGGSRGGGGGSGISYSMGSRTALALPAPEYPTQRSGKVVVRVWVNKQGRVLRAEPGEKGSTTFDTSLLEAARAAALRAQFDVTHDAPETQVGTITYVFRLRQ